MKKKTIKVDFAWEANTDDWWNEWWWKTHVFGRETLLCLLLWIFLVRFRVIISTKTKVAPPRLSSSESVDTFCLRESERANESNRADGQPLLKLKWPNKVLSHEWTQRRRARHSQEIGPSCGNGRGAAVMKSPRWATMWWSRKVLFFWLFFPKSNRCTIRKKTLNILMVCSNYDIFERIRSMEWNQRRCLPRHASFFLTDAVTERNNSTLLSFYTSPFSFLHL